jgi:hypothetical protein
VLWITHTHTHTHTRSTRRDSRPTGDLERRDAFGEVNAPRAPGDGGGETLEGDLRQLRLWCFRKLDRDQPTLLLDEYDAIWKDRDQEPLGALLKAGNKPGTRSPAVPAPTGTNSKTSAFFVQLTTY